MESDKGKIKSKQDSKKDRTLLMLYMYILKKSFLVNQIDDFPSSNKK